MNDDDRGWTTFASNVGKARIEQREAAEIRLRWAGVVLLALLMTAAGFFSVRYFGVRAGWWSTLLPMHAVTANAHAMIAHVISRFYH
jgi:hypothetical protein